MSMPGKVEGLTTVAINRRPPSPPGDKLTAMMCPLCRCQVDAQPYSPDTWWAKLGDLPTGRLFTQGDVVFRHHGCESGRASSDQGGRFWPDGAWWACLEPERPLDSLAQFDVSCADCGERWGIPQPVRHRG